MGRAIMITEFAGVTEAARAAWTASGLRPRWPGLTVTVTSHCFAGSFRDCRLTVGHCHRLSR